MSSLEQDKKRGFTSQEKWVIWGVFCLLLGLSTSRISVFAGLLLLSAGASLISKRDKLALAVLLCIAGGLNLVFSKFLI